MEVDTNQLTICSHLASAAGLHPALGIFSKTDEYLHAAASSIKRNNMRWIFLLITWFFGFWYIGVAALIFMFWTDNLGDPDAVKRVLAKAYEEGKANAARLEQERSVAQKQQ